MSRYRQLAQTIKAQIQQQVWRSGEKVLSIRAASKSYSVSAATVLQAYQLLESEGWLTAKPQSGYFVTSTLVAPRDNASSAPKPIPYDDALYEYLKTCNQSDVALGAAFPSSDLFSMSLLNRHLASAGRKLPADSVLHNLPPGNESLRRSIAQRYIANGISVSHHDIVITSGAMEALNLSLQVVTKAGDNVVVEAPTFYGAIEATKRRGLNLIEVGVNPELGVDLVELERAIKQQDVQACWLMPNYHNPTGSLLDDESKQAVMALANQYDVMVIEDDVYAELYFGEQKPKPLKYWDTQDRVLLCGSFSKSLCPGYRIGWVVNRTLSERLQKQQLLSTLSSSSPIQSGIAHYLQYESLDNHLRKLRKDLKQRQTKLVAFLQQVLPEEVTLHVPDGGYFVWLVLPKAIQTHKIYQQLLLSDVSVAYGDLFSTSSQFGHCLRLNVSYELTPEIEQALKQLAKLIENELFGDFSV